MHSSRMIIKSTLLFLDRIKEVEHSDLKHIYKFYLQILQVQNDKSESKFIERASLMNLELMLQKR